MKRLNECGSSAIGQMLLVGSLGLAGVTAFGSLGGRLAENVSGRTPATMGQSEFSIPELSGRSEAASASVFGSVARALEKIELPTPSAQRYGAVALRVDAPAELADDVWAKALSHIGRTEDVAANRANAIAALGDEGQWRGLLVAVMEDLHARQVSIRVDPRDLRPGGHGHENPGYYAIQQAMPNGLRTPTAEQQFYGFSRPETLRKLAKAAQSYADNPPPAMRGGRQWFGDRFQYNDLTFDEGLIERLVAVGEAFGEGMSEAKRNRLFGEPGQNMASSIYVELDIPHMLRTTEGEPIAATWKDAETDRVWERVAQHMADGAYEQAYTSLEAIPGRDLLLGYLLEARARVGKSAFDYEVRQPKTRGQLSPEGQVLSMASPGQLAYYANKLIEGNSLDELRYVDGSGYIDQAFEARLKEGMKLAAGERVEPTHFGR